MSLVTQKPIHHVRDLSRDDGHSYRPVMAENPLLSLKFDQKAKIYCSQIKLIYSTPNKTQSSMTWLIVDIIELHPNLIINNTLFRLHVYCKVAFHEFPQELKRSTFMSLWAKVLLGKMPYFLLIKRLALHGLNLCENDFKPITLTGSIVEWINTQSHKIEICTMNINVYISIN